VWSTYSLQPSPQLAGTRTCVIACSPLHLPFHHGCVLCAADNQQPRQMDHGWAPAAGAVQNGTRRALTSVAQCLSRTGRSKANEAQRRHQAEATETKCFKFHVQSGSQKRTRNVRMSLSAKISQPYNSVFSRNKSVSTKKNTDSRALSDRVCTQYNTPISQKARTRWIMCVQFQARLVARTWLAGYRTCLEG
jgi:hypothetical protein